MRNFIGHIHDTRSLTNQQINEAKRKIKEMLRLDTIHIGKANGGFHRIPPTPTSSPQLSPVITD